MVFVIMRYRISHTHSCGFISLQNTRKFCQMTEVYQWGKMNSCALRLRFINHLCFTSDSYQVPRRNLFKFLAIFIHCCFCCGYLHCLKHWNKFNVPYCNAAVNCLLFLSYGPHDISAYAVLCGFTGFQDTRNFWFELIGFSTGLSMRTSCLSCKAWLEPSAFPISCKLIEEEDVLVVNGKCESKKGETCVGQMTDSFQGHKDVMQFLSQARAMRSALVKRLYCAVCEAFMGVLSWASFDVFVSIFHQVSVQVEPDASRLNRATDGPLTAVVVSTYQEGSF